MDGNSLILYRKFTDEEQVNALIQILQAHQIHYEVTQDRASLDSLYGVGMDSKQFFVKIKQEDFAKADNLLLREVEKDLANVDPTYHLFSFSDEELFEILTRPDEWNEFDIQLAKRILGDRGKEINSETIDLLKKQRVRELAQPEKGSKAWIYAGYILALLGGLLAIFMGYAIITSTKVLPDGKCTHGLMPIANTAGEFLY